MNNTEKVYQSVGLLGCGLSKRKIGVRYNGAEISLLSRVSDWLWDPVILPTSWHR